jgi:Mg2+-importing ATPase
MATEVEHEVPIDVPIEALFAKLGVTEAGLTTESAQERLERYGPNVLAQKKKRSGVIDFVLRFKNPLVLILLFAAVISGFLGDVVDMSIIFVIIFIGIILDFFQETKASQAAEMLQAKVTTTADVLRDGIVQEVQLAEIVPGDIVSLSAGYIVPGDARVITARDLFSDQSALTGESYPVEKFPMVIDQTGSITDWLNMLFMGTSIVSGSGTALVVATGSNTEYGRIAQRLVQKERETEFDRSTRKFGTLMVEVTSILVIFVFFVNAIANHGILNSFMFAVALAVGLTPELLPMIISLNLSKGAIAMSRHGVIVKKLSSIQNFGNMDVLCTDKTGTLTENKIALVKHIDIEGNENDRVFELSYLNSYFETGLKSPLDDAILAYETVDVAGSKKVDEIPFDFNRKMVSIVLDQGGDSNSFIIKGAPEEILKACSGYEFDGQVSELDEEASARIKEKFDSLSADGFRALGVAYKDVSKGVKQFTIDDEQDLTFLGFVAFLDPPKESVGETIRSLIEFGIDVKILTGDNELVTKRVCEEIGLSIKGVVLGTQVTQMGDDALARVVETSNIFARVNPGQKNRIMHALQLNGHVVGFLGDGINDAPSIKAADVGISVDNAVDVAKEAADLILLEKDLTVLHDGALEGRKTFSNTLKYLMMATSSNFGNMVSVSAASVFLPFIPMWPTQILLNNLLYDISETTIPTDNVDEEQIRKPRKMDVSFIRRFMLIMGPVSSIFDIVTFVILIFLFNGLLIQNDKFVNEQLFRTAWWVESIATQTLVIFVLRARKVPFYRSKPSPPLFWSSIIIVAFSIALPYIPVLGPAFQFVPLPLLFYLYMTGIVVAYLALAEFTKRWFYKKYVHLVEFSVGQHEHTSKQKERVKQNKERDQVAPAVLVQPTNS